MEGREGRPPMESLLQGLTREQRIALAGKVIGKYEAMLRSTNEIANRAAELQQASIEQRGTPLTMQNIHLAAQEAVTDATKLWYTWIRKELLQFDTDDAKEALGRLGLLEKE